MKRVLQSLALTVYLAFSTSLAHSQAHTFTYDLDLRQIIEESGELGIDFSVQYELAKSGKSPMNLSVDLRGFRALEEGVADANQLAGEARLQGHFYRTTDRIPLPPVLRNRYLRLTDIPTEEWTDAEEEEVGGLQRMIDGRGSWYASYDLHYRVETTSDIDSSSHAFGLGLSTELPLLHRLLDVIPELTGVGRPATFRVQPVRARLSLDYVQGPAGWATVGESRDLGRVRLEAAWSTMILNGLTLRTTWEGEYLFSGPQLIEDTDRQFNSFFQTWVVLDLNGNTGVEVKLIDGRLPPSYEAVSGTVLGLNLVFAK